MFPGILWDNLTLSIETPVHLSGKPGNSMDNPERFHGHPGHILTLNSMVFSMVFPWFPCIFRVFLYFLLRVPGKAKAGLCLVFFSRRPVSCANAENLTD